MRKPLAAGILMNRAVFLDRDGVLNRVIVQNGRPYPPPGMAELEILPGVIDAARELHEAGFRLIVVTNQPDVATGRQRREVVQAMHDHLCEMLPLDAVKVCYHVDADGCNCRKPKPGMLLEAASEWDIALDRSYMIGDRWRDIDAGKAAGCQTILVQGNYEERQPFAPDAVASSLAEAAAWILGREKP